MSALPTPLRRGADLYRLPTLSPGKELHAVGLVITEACNFRCCMCDYWRIEDPAMMPLSMVERLAPALIAERPRSVTITGGEPLMHPEWDRIAAWFSPHTSVRLCTSGLLLRKHRAAVLAHVDRLLVSIDGADDKTFELVRGAKNVARIWRSLAELKEAKPDLRVDVKMTIQKRNHHQVLEFLEACLERPYVDGVGFGMPDFSLMAFELGNGSARACEADDGKTTASTTADVYRATVALDADEARVFAATVARCLERHGALFDNGYVFEGDLPRYLRRFELLAGGSTPPDIRRCSIPNYNLAVYPDGTVRGCFFMGSDATVDDVLARGASGVRWALQRRDAFDSTRTPGCQSCDQLLFKNSPYERQP